MQLIKRFFLFIVIVCCGRICFAQLPAKTPMKIAVFAPIYLDSAFADGNYKLGNANLPRQMVAGLDFYNGVMLAIDSLNKEQVPITVLFYDTKSSTLPLQKLVAGDELKEVSLLIASFNNRSDIKPLADLALQMKIPLISSTYPNDGGITGNPFFAMVNPTLKAHLEAIYRYLHKTYPTEKMTLFRRNGAIEDMIEQVITDMNKKTPGLPLKINTINLPDSFTVAQVTETLDSAKQNILICGSLDEEFGTELSKALAASRNYKTISMGMPTWEGIRDISKNIEVIYTSPFNFLRNDKLLFDLFSKYKAKYSGRPNDMFFKGFESMYHFSKLLVKYPTGIIKALSDKDFKLFNEFDFQPIRSGKQSNSIDYLENKKIYFIRKMDGLVKSVN